MRQPTAPTFLLDEQVFPPLRRVLRYRTGRGVSAQLIHALFHLARFRTPPDPSALVSGVVCSSPAGIEVIAMTQLRDPLIAAVTYGDHPALDPSLRAETLAILTRGEPQRRIEEDLVLDLVQDAPTESEQVQLRALRDAIENADVAVPRAVIEAHLSDDVLLGRFLGTLWPFMGAPQIPTESVRLAIHYLL